MEPSFFSIESPFFFAPPLSLVERVDTVFSSLVSVRSVDVAPAASSRGAPPGAAGGRDIPARRRFAVMRPTASIASSGQSSKATLSRRAYAIDGVGFASLIAFATVRR